MPIYLYRCQECGEEVEKIHPYSKEVSLECPKCKKDALKKTINSNVHFRMKGHLLAGGSNAPIYRDLHVKKKKYYPTS
jgi:putative FmdB family regulatory protein